MNIVIAGGGFIGAHLAAALLAQGHGVRCVDRRPLDEWCQVHEDAENVVADLRRRDACTTACEGMAACYQLAADMGGIGFIETNKTLCMLDPVNLGSNELTTIDGLVDVVEDVAGVTLNRRYRLDAPRGVNGRNSDNAMLRRALAWEPSICLRDGMERTYRWIHDEYVKKYGLVERERLLLPNVEWSSRAVRQGGEATVQHMPRSREGALRGSPAVELKFRGS